MGLDNLTVVIDHNKLQAMDELENIIHMRPFANKWKAFDWEVVEIDGHNYKEVKDALLVRKVEKPVLVIVVTEERYAEECVSDFQHDRYKEFEVTGVVIVDKNRIGP